MTNRPQEQQHDSESFFRSVFDSLGTAAAITYRDGTFYLINQAMEQMGGYRREEVENLHKWQDFVHPEDLPALQKIADARQFDNSLVPRRHEFRLVDSRGKYHNIVINVSSIPGTDLQINSLTEVTDLKQIEAQLRRSAAQYRMLVDHAADIIWTMDMNLKMTYISPSAERIFGWTFEEWLELPIEAQMTPESLARIRERMALEMEHLLAEGADPSRFTVIEIEQIRKDGSTFWAEVMIRWILDENLQPVGLTGITRDISERRRLQEVLIQSEKMATVAGLAAGMAHEINNPLGIIMQSSENAWRRMISELPANRLAAEKAGLSMEALHRYLADRKVDRYLQAIHDAGARAARIVASMLHFSRQSASAASLNNVNSILERTMELAASDYDLNKKYDFKRVKIVKEYGAVPDIPCVENELEQVFLNLLNNAAHAMAGKPYLDESPVIRISTFSDDKSVFVEIEDNGPGLDEETRKRIFEPFYTTKEPGSGTGLGLSISYYLIVNSHCGHISVDSQPGRWSRFTVELPRERTTAPGSHLTADE